MSSLIAQLRVVAPNRPLTYVEGLRVAELQASKFRAALGLTDPALPEEAITDLPRVIVERITPLLVGGVLVPGATKWVQGRWVILLNGADHPGRQRFSLAHELKHVLDGPAATTLYPSYSLGRDRHHRVEQVCHYFAGCLLMPRPLLKRAWTTKSQDLVALAQLFEVSPAAMQVRLLQTGLMEPPRRCAWQERPARRIPALASVTDENRGDELSTVPVAA